MGKSAFDGFTNYTTMRVYNEIFTGLRFGYIYGEFTAQDCKHYAEDFIAETATTESFIAHILALAYLSKVNWEEIAQKLEGKY